MRRNAAALQPAWQMLAGVAPASPCPEASEPRQEPACEVIWKHQGRGIPLHRDSCVPLPNGRTSVRRILASK